MMGVENTTVFVYVFCLHLVLKYVA